MIRKIRIPSFPSQTYCLLFHLKYYLLNVCYVPVTVLVHMNLPEVRLLLPYMSKPHCVRWICLFSTWGHFKLNRNLCFGLCLKWEMTGCPKPMSLIIRREIWKRLTTVRAVHSSHLPYLVFVVKTCLLKHVISPS